jgi:hypothetical protein
MKEHQHRWTVESRHPTSVGVVAYHRCACGARRIVEYELSSPTVVSIRSEAARSASMSPAPQPGPGQVQMQVDADLRRRSCRRSGPGFRHGNEP